MELKENNVEQKIDENIKNKKIIVNKQITLLQRFIVSGICQVIDDVDKEELGTTVQNELAAPLYNITNELFDKYYQDDKEFYMKNVKTVSLVCDTVENNKTRNIYLNNISKKISERNYDVDMDIQRKRDPKNGETDNINHLFSKIISSISKQYGLNLEEADEVLKVVDKYHMNFITDLYNGIESFINDDRKIVYNFLEKKVPAYNGLQQSLLESSLASETIRVSHKKLEEIISINEKELKESLALSAYNMVKMIFKNVPEKYRNHDSLASVAESYVNDNLEDILKKENKEIVKNIDQQNSASIRQRIEGTSDLENKKEINYRCNGDRIDNLFNKVLKELRSSYNLSSDDYQAKRLDLLVKSSSNLFKESFNSYIEKVYADNKKIMDVILQEVDSMSMEFVGVNSKDIAVEERINARISSHNSSKKI